ncbi:MAG TPA: phosphatidate cytidylyltransferase [Pirellulales bacterium]|jgi:phosphatidate cytidylyltransferase|nr:phosphatidate cytidylyltransferase [Pirellulales bacterium]
MDVTTIGLVGSVLALLGLATGVGQVLKRQAETGLDPAAVEQFNLRIRAWWLLCAVLAAAFFLTGTLATEILFGLLSFWALREFITLTPTRAADHRALFWVFFAFTPLQYVLVARNEYSLYSIVIPVYGFLFIPARVALAGDFKRYLERCAKIQAGLMICVYCLSHAPALLHLRFAQSGYDNRRLLFYFILVVVAGDAFGYICEKLFGKHVIAPAINANRTWEGFLGGMACATLFGMAMSWATPFGPAYSAMMSAVISVMGFAGGITMSAIKRDRGVKDYGTLVQGHGGVLDRIDSICFAAPVFFHLTRYLFVP